MYGHSMKWRELLDRSTKAADWTSDAWREVLAAIQAHGFEPPDDQLLDFMAAMAEKLDGAVTEFRVDAAGQLDDLVADGEIHLERLDEATWFLVIPGAVVTIQAGGAERVENWTEGEDAERHYILGTADEALRAENERLRKKCEHLAVSLVNASGDHSRAEAQRDAVLAENDRLRERCEHLATGLKSATIDLGRDAERAKALDEVAAIGQELKLDDEAPSALDEQKEPRDGDEGQRRDEDA